MFLTEHNPGRIYTVNLAQDPAIIQQNAHAHLYRYFSGGKQGRFSGEATLLPAIRVAMAFPPTTPAVTTASAQDHSFRVNGDSVALNGSPDRDILHSRMVQEEKCPVDLVGC
jgi:hypothetical protein